ncbi:MAG: Fic family protein [Nanoarchaeota archaeon]|mgnify:CR=1 FL=1
MAFIHVKRIGDTSYYTLRVSTRKGDRVITKDLCSLGSDLSKVDLGSLEKKYHAEIRKSYKTLKKFLETNHYLEKAKKEKPVSDAYFNKEQLLEISAIHLHYHARFLKLDNLTQGEVMENFTLNFAVNSTSIEGNTITMKQAHALFKEDIMPKGRTLREVHDLTNTKKAWEYLMAKKPKIDIVLVEYLHDMLLEGIDARNGFRMHDIRIFGQPFKPTPARYVIPDVKILLSWYEENKSKMHPLALSAFFHHKFENIHPFSDGNGRTGRMLMNYILFLSGYPPMVISRRFRKEYLDVMNKADKSLRQGITKVDRDYYENLLEFIYSQYRVSYWDIFLI